ncbi:MULTISPECIES: CCA tRNA nucleotidyltransferase [Brucella/Ochrobactrum group]|uniref:CCA tRNA nucleotidyltransferase n=1 Tax=Brucella pseudintermedia TaxID=370111 RepID=A0ABY5UCZ6_9HYPH|nr:MULTISPECIES: CCA tRNA nucleotidyltransferase [Brucella/Ochrobactrum group]KAB2685400.1 CCA tRNA nucleotidyltransferase [Brucella pseudintermedia]MCO7728894.1 CCA tRNA nucleotidyltransferase [Brucella intermedia]NKE76733.1 CCA tRNA nucleotidyltransferase [Ochrobactrum sp. MC-1LL]TWH00748.1 poly(A) polymerase [Ochrobactrum sp. J50]UWL61210.1 CCA tRNA nucleotidyltransferase [Brucella pseudintermedia]
MSETINISGKADWLKAKPLQALFKALNRDGGEARVVGGAVRNTLLGSKVSDVDLATTHLPQETVRLAKEAGFKPVPTGIEHGTITVVVQGHPFEVTTLRQDVETDGRHAKVAFGTDWKADAERRDFTINALYMTADGTIIDDVGGLADIESRTLRFIGDAEQRIREDYLRILRFFRFFAWYGSGRPEADGLRASARLKDGLAQLSAERVWAELKKLLSAPDPSRALLWMRQGGVLNLILPESEKWGIDAIHGLVRTEADLGWQADPLLRLASIVPPDSVRMEEMGKRLKMSNAERARLEAWARADAVKPELSEQALKKTIYRGSKQAVLDRIRLAYAAARADAAGSDDAMIRAGGFARLLDAAERYDAPVFPVTGSDLLALGIEKGPGLGEVLRSLETFWIDSGFSLDRAALLDKLDRG